MKYRRHVFRDVFLELAEQENGATRFCSRHFRGSVALHFDVPGSRRRTWGFGKFGTKHDCTVVRNYLARR